MFLIRKVNWRIPWIDVTYVADTVKDHIQKLTCSFICLVTRERFVDKFAICMFSLHVFFFLISHTDLPLQMHAYPLAIFLHVGFLAPFTCMQDGGLNIVNGWQLLSNGTWSSMHGASYVNYKRTIYTILAVPHHQFMN